MENPNLPPDLVVEILLRLPVKSLLRFKCICKSWLAVISDSQFAKSQFNLAAAVNHRVILRSDNSYSEIESVDVEASLYDDSAVVNLRIPEPCRDPCFRIFASCRGLVFLVHGGDIAVWNPSTDAHRRIPLHGDSLLLDHLHGVGYEESKDDYLIVSTRLHSPQIQVFSLKTNVASFVHGVDFDHHPIAAAGLLLNESLHWLVFSRATQLYVVLAFDLILRSLFEIPLSPDLAAELTGKQHHLNIMGGYLCLCYEGRDDKCENAQIWLMKEYKVPSSWTKSFVLRFISYKYKCFYPICFTRCGGLFGSSGYGGLMKFNDKAHFVEWRTRFPYNGFVKPHNCYRESLVSLPSGVDEEK